MKIFFILLSFCISACCFGQKGDYLVKNNGDTIWGEIKLLQQTFFVTGIANVTVSADEVNTIKSKKYNGNTVISCSLERYTDNLSYLELGHIVKGKKDTVLILNEIFSTPKINLYFAKDDDRVPYYFYKTPSDPKPVQLIIHFSLDGGLSNYAADPVKYRGVNGRLQVVEDKAYVNQLRAIMGNCKKIPDTMWEILSYRDYSFKQLFKRYNKCK